MKKKIILVIGFIILCSGCTSRGKSYELLYGTDQINKIEIINVENRYDAKYDYSVLKEIDDYINFVKDFEKIEYKRYFSFGSLPNINQGNALLIDYDNGDTEYIGYTAGVRFKSGEKTTIRLWCDEDEFTTFINSYL